MPLIIDNPTIDTLGSPYLEPDVGDSLEKLVRTYSSRVHSAQYTIAKHADANTVGTGYVTVRRNIQKEIDYLSEHSRKENRYIKFMKSNLQHLTAITETISGDAAYLTYNNNLLYGEYKYDDRTSDGDPRYYGVHDHIETLERVLASREQTKQTIDAMLIYCIDLMSQLQELEDERE